MNTTEQCPHVSLRKQSNAKILWKHGFSIVRMTMKPVNGNPGLHLDAMAAITSFCNDFHPVGDQFLNWAAHILAERKRNDQMCLESSAEIKRRLHKKHYLIRGLKTAPGRVLP